MTFNPKIIAKKAWKKTVHHEIITKIGVLHMRKICPPTEPSHDYDVIIKTDQKLLE